MADREYVQAGPEKVNLLDTADQDLIRVRVRGDTQDRFVLQGDGQMFIGNGSVVPTVFGRMVIPPAADQTGLVVQGQAGQTADLLQLQSSAGTTLALVTAGGSVRSGTQMVIGSTSNPIGAPLTVVNTLGAGVTAVVVQGQAGQTADLLQLKDSAGAVLAKVGPSGYFHGSALLPLSLTGNITALDFTLGTLRQQLQGDSVGSVIRGFAGQAADLLQLQSSAGISLARVSAAGNLSIAETLNINSGGALVNASAGGSMVLRAAAYNLQTLDGTASPMVLRGNTADATETLLVKALRADQPALVTRGAVGQSNSLFQVQDSAGILLVDVNAAGHLAPTFTFTPVLPGPATTARKTLELGAADSAGAGFRTVRVAN